MIGELEALNDQVIEEEEMGLEKRNSRDTEYWP
jgi:hypothetical protein